MTITGTPAVRAARSAERSQRSCGSPGFWWASLAASDPAELSMTSTRRVPSGPATSKP